MDRCIGFPCPCPCQKNLNLASSSARTRFVAGRPPSLGVVESTRSPPTPGHPPPPGSVGTRQCAGNFECVHNGCTANTQAVRTLTRSSCNGETCSRRGFRLFTRVSARTYPHIYAYRTWRRVVLRILLRALCDGDSSALSGAAECERGAMPTATTSHGLDYSGYFRNNEGSREKIFR